MEQDFDIVITKALGGILYQYAVINDSKIDIVASQLVIHVVDYHPDLTPYIKTIQQSLNVVKTVAGYQTVVLL